MISAVAFSISMRTERTAAAAYRRGLMARELLDNAFVDARATVEHALRDQQETFNVRDASTRTVKNLAPFRYPNSDTQYGRVMVSFDPAESDAIAYLLDDAVMAHVPPYMRMRSILTLKRVRRLWKAMVLTLAPRCTALSWTPRQVGNRFWSTFLTPKRRLAARIRPRRRWVVWRGQL